jgi:hypothetical protein
MTPLTGLKMDPERTSPNDIASHKLAALFIKLQMAFSKDIATADRNYIPGLRLAMNLLLDIDRANNQ